MVIPNAVVVPLFLVTFVLACYQYYCVNPKRRMLNFRFGLMVAGIVGGFSYPLVRFQLSGHPSRQLVSFIYLAVALFCVSAAYFLLRRMPARET